MIIQNNTSLNILNQLKRATLKGSKATEKLSSGLRINQASDDAAGLTISEKMRAQIRGLGQAERNIQDGISLLQTAEGALGNIEDHLQRIRELAVEASNDSLTSDDRQAIQNEAEQLNESINDIANQTEFNNIKLLNKPAFIDVTKISNSTSTTHTVSSEEVLPNINFKETSTSKQLLNVCYADGKYVAVGRDGDVAYSTDGTNWNYPTIPSYILDGITYGDGKFVAVGANGAILTSNDGSVWSTQSSGLNNSNDYYIHSVAYNGNIFVATAVNYNATSPNKILTSTDGVSWNNVDDDGFLSEVTWGDGQFVAVGSRIMTSTDGVNWTDRGSSGISVVNSVSYVGNKFIALGNSNQAQVSDDGVIWRAINIANDNSVDLYHVASDGNQFVVIGDDFSGANRAKIYHSLDGTNWSYQDVPDGNLLSGIVWENGEYVAVGFNRIDQGVIEIPADQPSETTIDTTSSTTTENSENVTTTIKTNSQKTTTVSQRHTDISITNITDMTETTETSTTTITRNVENEDSQINLQIGANSGQGFNIQLTDVRVAALGIDSLDLTNGNDAVKAIDQVDQAIEKISSERSKFGSYQNALDNMYNEVTQYKNNLSEAESQIRDVDMASEMMNQTKSSVLAQAAQVMLTQANQQPQQVLQLLR